MYVNCHYIPNLEHIQTGDRARVKHWDTRGLASYEQIKLRLALLTKRSSDSNPMLNAASAESGDTVVTRGIDWLLRVWPWNIEVGIQ